MYVVSHVVIFNRWLHFQQVPNKIYFSAMKEIFLLIMALCFSKLNPLFTLSFSGAIQIAGKMHILIKIGEGSIVLSNRL